MDYDAHARLVQLLEEATRPELQSLDTATLSSAKAMLRDSEDNVRTAHELLLFKLKKDNAQVRFLALLLVDEIFRRSAAYRALLIPLLETVLELTVGMRTEKPLPEPRAAARRLEKKAIEVIEGWNDKFGSRHRQVRLAYRYLRDVLRYQFPNLPARAREAERVRREAERAAQADEQARYVRFEEAWGGAREEAQALLRQLEECLALLKGERQSGRHGEGAAGFEDSAADGIDAGVWDGGVGGPSLVESEENLAVVETLRDLYRALCQQHLRASQGWLATLMRDPGVDQQRRGRHEQLLREVMALRSDMLAYKGRCEALGVELRKMRLTDKTGVTDEGDDEEMWEEGDIPEQDELVGDEAEEVRALGLMGGNEALAHGAVTSDAVRELVSAFGDESAEGQEEEPWTPVQSNLVLKPGGRGLARTDGLVTQRKAEGWLKGGKAASGADVSDRPRPTGLASVQPPGGVAAWVEMESFKQPEAGRKDQGTFAEHAGSRDLLSGERGEEAEAPRSSQGKGNNVQVAQSSKAARSPARDPAARKEGRPDPAPFKADSRGPGKPGPGSNGGIAAGVVRPEARSSALGSTLSELRASAPVVPWGSYLDHWGAEGSVPVDARGLVIENHWGPVDREATLPAERMREMSMRATYYEPEKKEVKACRAPLPGGGLCSRRDLMRCPMHGPVIPRDERGRPVTPQTRQSETTLASPSTAVASAGQSLLPGVAVERDLEGNGTEAGAALGERNRTESGDDASELAAERAGLLHDVARQAVENVRKRDEGEAADKQAARKKARVSAQERLRDRAHNEAMLREAAIRGSRQRLGEELGGHVEGEERPAEGDGSSGGRLGEGGREKRRGGASGARGGRAQLTVRQRIRRRLLNARVRNATTSVLEAEESKRSQTMNANRWENR